MNSLRGLLHELAADRFTGRVTVKSVAGGWVYLHDGTIYCAEQRERPTLLVAMGEAGLFTADEWQQALRTPYVGDKWPTLAGGDPQRLAALRSFAHDYVGATLQALVRQHHADVAVANLVAHPFGPLAGWSIDDLVDEAALTSPSRRSLLDRVEFLELLEEVSPSIRRVHASALSPLG